MLYLDLLRKAFNHNGTMSNLACDTGMYVIDLLKQQKAVSMVGTSDALTAGS